ncbi:hypothetical protein FPV67DRAFT_1728594 [Lyophyllum atratum]|nr:hypothetical protein FPV67DRAFT_1728594 [Lyophyllum atratum]
MSNSSSYAAIIDAGSTSSRLFLYQWQSDVALGEPMNLRTVFPSNPSEKKASEALGAGQAFLSTHSIHSVPLYLLATGGMREDVPPETQSTILHAAHKTMSSFHASFDVGRWETHARVIPGRVEGLYG